MPAISQAFTNPAGWNRGDAWKQIYALSGGHETFLGHMPADAGMFFRADTAGQAAIAVPDTYGALLLAHYYVGPDTADRAVADIVMIFEKGVGDTLPTDARIPGFTFAYDGDQTGSLSDTLISDGAGQQGWAITFVGEGSETPGSTLIPWTRRQGTSLFVNRTAFHADTPRTGYTDDGFLVVSTEFNIRAIAGGSWTGDLGIAAFRWTSPHSRALSPELINMRNQLRTLSGV